MKQHSVKKWVFVVAGLLGALPVLCQQKEDPSKKDAGAEERKEAGTAQRPVRVFVFFSILRRQDSFMPRHTCGHVPMTGSCSSDIEDLGSAPRSCHSAPRCGDTCASARRPDGMQHTLGAMHELLSGARTSAVHQIDEILADLQWLNNGAVYFKLTMSNGTSIDLIGSDIRELLKLVIRTRGAGLTPQQLQEVVVSRENFLETVLAEYDELSPEQQDCVGYANLFVEKILRLMQILLPRA